MATGHLSKTKTMNNSRLPSQQKGAVIILVLVILMILSLLGVNSMTTSAIEERMSANVSDRNIAFQAAEAALGAAERLVEDGTFNTLKEAEFFDFRDDLTNLAESAADVCKNGLCNCVDPDPLNPNSPCLDDGTDYWTNTSVDVWQNVSRHRTYSITGATTNPKFIIEFMGYINPPNPLPTDQLEHGDMEMFRITAKGYGRSPNSVVTLQSTYKRIPP